MSSAGVDSEGLDALVIVSTYNSIERRSNGGFQYSEGNERVLPLEWVSEH